MARGRLEIYDPNGPVDNYLLQKDVVAIGRSVGNDLVLDKHGISRYHAKITFKDQQAFLEDLESANGTYVDGVRIKANESRILRGGEEIQMGDLRLVYHPAQEELDTTVQTVTQRIEIGTFQVELDGPDMAVTPGTHVPAILKIRNNSTTPQRVSIQVDGVPKEWLRVERHELEIAPDEKAQVNINFKPQRRPETKPGDYNVTVTVSSEYNPPVEISTRLQIQQFSGYGVAMGSPFLSEKQPFKMYVHNQGNGPLNLRFYGVSHGLPLEFNLQPANLTLGPGERQTIGGNIQLLQPKWFGKSQSFSYDIVSQSLDAAGFRAPISGHFQASPILPVWAPIAAISALGAIGLLLIALVLSLLNNSDDKAGDSIPPNAPTILAFMLNTQNPTLNTPLMLSWQTENAASVELKIQREGQNARTESLPDLSGNNYPLYIGEAGRYELELIATNQRGTSEQNTLVFVHPQTTLAVTTLPHRSTTLYRNLEGQQIEINWQVLWIDPDTASNGTSPDPDVYLIIPKLNIDQTETLVSTSKSINIGPLSSLDPLIITLRIIGPDDIQTETSQTINVLHPQCSTTDDFPQTDIYRGPSDQHPLISALPANIPVLIEARDQQGTWLQIQVPSDYAQASMPIGWVRVESVLCNGFNIQQLVVIADDLLPPLPPTPSPTPSITPTMTPTPPVPTPSPTSDNTTTPSRPQNDG